MSLYIYDIFGVKLPLLCERKVSKEVKRGHGMIERSHRSSRGQIKSLYRCRTFNVKRT